MQQAPIGRLEIPLLGLLCLACTGLGCQTCTNSSGNVAVEEIVSRIEAGRVRDIGELSPKDTETLRAAFNEHFNRVPCFDQALSVEEADFDKDIGSAVAVVAPICKGRSVGWVLDFFGKPSHVVWSRGVMLDYRTGVTATVSMLINRDGVLQWGGGKGNISVTFSWLSTGKAKLLQDILAKAKSPEELTDDEQAAFRRVLTALWQGDPLPQSVKGEESTLREAAFRFLELCKGRSLEYVLRMMGKPKTIDALEDRSLRMVYSMQDGPTVGLIFDIDGKLIEVREEKPLNSSLSRTGAK